MSDKSALANQYARAIVDAMLERWQSALGQAADALRTDEKADVAAVLPVGVPSEIINTLKLMQQQGNLDLVKDVAAALSQTVSGQRSPIKAEVTSAAELSSQEQAQLRQLLAEQHGDSLLFTFKVDPALLGGLRVRVGDRLIDTSIASRLTALRESLASVVR
jgi:F-type H+-transporting ATPase subunit delta